MKSMNNAEVLLHADNGRWAAANAQISAPGRTEKVWQFPQEMGVGSFSLQSLGENFSITLSDVRLNRALKAQVTGPGNTAYLVFSLLGNSVNSNDFFKDGFVMGQGGNTLYWSPDQGLTRQAAEGERLRAVVISFPQEKLQSLGDEARLLRKEGACIQHHNSTSITMVLQQIMNCRYTGGLRQLFLESKALELLTLKWSLLQPLQVSDLSPAQRRGVERVQRVLLEKISNPPSLEQLSRVAGMSHPVLTRCFKRLTGFSVFGYLRQQRLELSRNLIVESSMSMTEIAFLAGYSSSGHFSRAFAGYYGIQPSRLREKAGKG